MASPDPLTTIEGVPIFASDNEAIGHVKEVRETHLKVDAPMQQDYWLPRALVTLESPHQVLLSCDSREVERLKEDHPPA